MIKPSAQSAFLLAICCTLSPRQTRAQDPLPKVTDSPPPIAFDPWKLENTNATETEYSISFPSAIITSVPQNNTVPLRIFLPTNATSPVPVVLVLHYWGAHDLKVERSLAARLTSVGVGAVVMTLPYHLTRTPPGHSSGELAIQPDPKALVATMTQSVLDAKRTIDFIATRPEFDATRIGISGTSLGSIVSVLTYAVEPRIKAACFILGGVDLAHILWTSSIVVSQREQLRRKGFTQQSLRADLRDVEPLTYLPSRTTGDTFVIGAHYDTVVPAGNTKELIDSLTNPRVLWLETGHYGGIFVQRKLMREVSNYFSAQFQGKPYVPPKRIFVPTVRLGVIASTGPTSNFDVGIGFDLFRTHERHATFGTLMLTPRGPQAYVGYQIDRGFSIGPIAGLRRVGVGIMWSAIL